MLRFRRSSFNGVQDLLNIHGFRQLALYSTSISTEVNPNFVNYLVHNLGFSKQRALSASSKLTHSRSTDFVKNWDSVIAFLKKIGLQQSQIQSAISFYPRILMCNVDKTLIRKTEALHKLGFSQTHIAEVISVKPSFLLSSLDNAIIPGIQALREIMGSSFDAAHLTVILKRLPHGRVSAIHTCMAPNVALLRSYGIPTDLIRKYIFRNPFFFLLNTDRFQDVVISVEQKLRIPRNSPQFLAGAHLVSTFSDKNIESKLQIFKSFGWTDSHIATLASLNPCILMLSTDGIKKKLDYLMNELGYEPNYLASKACLFTCSLENRIVPRHKVLVVLKEKGLIKKDFGLPTALVYTESKFLKKFVLPFKQVHEVYSKNAGISLEMLTLGLSESKSSVV